jgi:hypothetical protein
MQPNNPKRKLDPREMARTGSGDLHNFFRDDHLQLGRGHEGIRNSQHPQLDVQEFFFGLRERHQKEEKGRGKMPVPPFFI